MKISMEKKHSWKQELQVQRPLGRIEHGVFVAQKEGQGVIAGCCLTMVGTQTGK